MKRPSACIAYLASSLATLALLAPPATAQTTGKESEPAKPPLSVLTLAAALQQNPTGDAAKDLADKVRTWMKKGLTSGTAVKTEGLDVAWAIEAPGAKEVEVVSFDRARFKMSMQPIGSTGVFALVTSMSNGTALRWMFSVDGKRMGGTPLEVYSIHPESLRQAGVPRGKLIEQKPWTSRIFDGSVRDWWIYVPAQYRASRPAALMVFTDGHSYIDQVPVVFDNLIAKGDMPVTVAVFVDPGAWPETKKSNRSFEYDTLSDQYARFLLEEILPEVEKSIKLNKDPRYRAIAGMSSGGIASFTAAWERPEQFGKVLSWIGSFTNIASGNSLREGGHNYPALIRKTPPKPIRIFLQDGSNDLDNGHGNWPLANEQMIRALEFVGYDATIVWGNGFHSAEHGRSILPDSLRWLWRDHKNPVTPRLPPATAQRSD